MSNHFDLHNEAAYQAWRARKLAHYPAGIEHTQVEIKDLGRPTRTELEEIGSRVASFNFALVRARPNGLSPRAVLDFGSAIGLQRTSANLFADDQAVSRIQQAAPGEGPGRQRADYIPYTNRPLSWHTDGYYNAPDSQIAAWMLFCVRPAAEGGVNALLDPEIAYIRLRDDSPRHIRALGHPQALCIPANIEDGRTLRPESSGPVFSIRQSHLHMRYSARTTNLIWRNSPDTHAARKALGELFSSATAFTFHLKLEAGEGIVSNNVLHTRSGFSDPPGEGSGRLLYRVRYCDRIALECGG